MKKVLFTAAVIGFVMTSCKKEYTCECKSSSTFPGYPATSQTSKTGKMKKKDAESKCNSGDVSSSMVDPFSGETYSINWDCEIKE